MTQKSRAIHPSDAQDDRLAALPLSAAYTYAYLPTVLDDEGRAKDQPPIFNGCLWPLRADEHPTEAMISDISALIDAGLLCRYTVGGQGYLHDPNWKTRQKISRPIPSKLPTCPTHDKAFEDVVGELFSKISAQVGGFLGTAASSIDQQKIRDSVVRIVEDVTFLVDPSKAASYGQKVREFFTTANRPSERPPSSPPSSDAPGNGKSDWSDTTDKP